MPKVQSHAALQDGLWRHEDAYLVLKYFSRHCCW